MLEGTPGGQFRPTLAQNRANVQVRSCCTELCSGVLKSSKNLYATFLGSLFWCLSTPMLKDQ